MPVQALPLMAVHNFRDYGGYAAAGGRLRPGLLWRSAQHQDATDADLAAIAGLNLGTIVDLRGDAERAAHPCRRPPGCRAAVLFAPGTTTGLAPHLEAARGSITAADARARMLASYAAMPYRPVLVATIAMYFSALANGAAPALIHCVAGKDRTGFAVALFHRLIGVASDDVMADYLLTNQVGDGEARIAQGAAALRGRYGDGLSDAAVRVIMGVAPDYLDAAFAAITASHGDIAAYARAELGVTADRIAAIEARLIV